MWLHGSGSRAASTLPPNHFYGYQGQSQLGGFRQAQQPQPSQFGGHGYPTFYQSQGGLTQEQHPQNLAEGSLNGFQVAPSQPSHPSWQHQHTYWALYSLVLWWLFLRHKPSFACLCPHSMQSKLLGSSWACTLSAERVPGIQQLERFNLLRVLPGLMRCDLFSIVSYMCGAVLYNWDMIT